MSLFKLIFTILILLSVSSYSQEICIKLEGITIGCVPSESHVCFRNLNLELDGGGGNCKYTKLEMTGFQYEAPSGAIAFQCASEVSETKCEKKPGSDNTVCTTTSTCKEYSNPVCQEFCILCHKKEIQVSKSVVGCLVCNRPECEEEKKARPSAFCPVVSKADPTFVLPKVSRPLCGGRRCNPNAPPTGPSPPFSVPDPKGVLRPVTVITGNCPALEMVEKGIEVQKKPSCPWINDPSPSFIKDGKPQVINNNSTAAEIAEACGNTFPIKPPNRFPEDWVPPK